MQEAVQLDRNAVSPAKIRRVSTFRRQLKKYKWLLLMTLPGVIYLFINNYIPMYGVILAFKNYNYVDGIWGSEWAGLDNFKFLFNSQDAYVITRNTFLYNFVFIVLNLVLAVLAALLINEIRDKVITRFYQSTFLLPHIISMVVVAYLVYSFLNVESGLVNRLIAKWFGAETVSWYGEPRYWPYILVIVNAWKNVGYLSVIYFAAIIGIDKEYYEAATIDGASKWKQMTRITIPLITPVITTMTACGQWNPQKRLRLVLPSADEHGRADPDHEYDRYVRVPGDDAVGRHRDVLGGGLLSIGRLLCPDSGS